MDDVQAAMLVVDLFKFDLPSFYVPALVLVPASVSHFAFSFLAFSANVFGLAYFNELCGRS